MKKYETIRMFGGTGSHSYSSNSSFQENSLSQSKMVVREAIKLLLNKFDPNNETTLAIADLGCSSGANAFEVTSQIMDLFVYFCSEKCLEPPEIQLFLNDLPGNDFETLLGPVLSSFQKKMSLPFYAATVTDSFYNRLFPKKSIHFFHSCFSLMWLSQVPQGLNSKRADTINKGSIYISETSPLIVSELYEQQFKRDFSLFLNHRSEELHSDVGHMVLILLGRKISDPSEKTFLFFVCLTEALAELVSKGKLKASDVDAFNLPVYYPSMEEVKLIIKENGSFDIINDYVMQKSIEDGFNLSSVNSTNEYKGKIVTNCIRAVFEPVLASHFGDSKMDELFSIMARMYGDNFREERNAVTLTISLKKKLQKISC